MAVQSGSLTSTVATGAYTISSTTQITYVQSNYATPQTAQTSVPVKYSAAQHQGDLNVVVVGWNDATVAVSGVTDTNGNTYARAVGPTVISGTATQSIYYATNIVAAGAGTNTVTVLFNGAATAADIRILEYSGIDTTSPFDVAAAATSSGGTTVSSGTATTTHARDLIIGADLTTGETAGPGAGFTARHDHRARCGHRRGHDRHLGRQLLGDRGPVRGRPDHHADGGLQGRRHGCRQPADRPDQPGGRGHRRHAVVSLTWGAASESGGTITQYLIERCAGSSCTNFAQVNTATGLSFSDSGLTGTTSYSYRVRAKDASAHTGPYSNIASATTATPIPTAPTNLAATASGATQVNLSWGAASEAGRSGDRVPRRALPGGRVQRASRRSAPRAA